MASVTVDGRRGHDLRLVGDFAIDKPHRYVVARRQQCTQFRLKFHSWICLQLEVHQSLSLNDNDEQTQEIPQITIASAYDVGLLVDDDDANIKFSKSRSQVGCKRQVPFYMQRLNNLYAIHLLEEK